MELVSCAFFFLTFWQHFFSYFFFPNLKRLRFDELKKKNIRTHQFSFLKSLKPNTKKKLFSLPTFNPPKIPPTKWINKVMADIHAISLRVPLCGLTILIYTFFPSWTMLERDFGK